MKVERLELLARADALTAENKQVTKICSEMERVIGSEQEKLQGAREQVRALREQMLDQQTQVA